MHCLKSVVHRILSTKKNSYLGETWIDVGCGERPYEHLFQGVKYIGIDLKKSGRPDHMKKADVYYDGVKLPYDDSSFDGVLSTQVLQLIPNPSSYLLEAKRVLKQGGYLIISVPFVFQEHEQPDDYFRFTSFGIRSLLTRSGFEIKEFHKIGGTIETIAQCLSVWCICHLHFNSRILAKLVTTLLCFPIQITGIVLQKILPDQKNLFLDILVIAQKK